VIRIRGNKVYIASAMVMLIFIVGTLGMFLLSLTASRPTNLGVTDGRLAPCAESPNCVSTQAEDHDHWIAPITYQGDTGTVIETLDSIVRQMPRTSVIEKSREYLYAEFRSAFFRFTDDVEFFVEAESGRIHFRSASRVGRSDLGVNRERMELIRSRFQSLHSGPDAMPKKLVAPLESKSARQGLFDQ